MCYLSLFLINLKTKGDDYFAVRIVVLERQSVPLFYFLILDSYTLQGSFSFKERGRELVELKVKFFSNSVHESGTTVWRTYKTFSLLCVNSF